MRSRQQRRQPVDQGYGRLTCAHQREDAEQTEHPTMKGTGMRLCHQGSGDDRCNQRDRAYVQQQRKLAARLPKRFRDSKADLHFALKLLQSLVDQVEADMRRVIIAALPGRAFQRKLDRRARHLGLGSRAALGDLLHRVAVTVTRREVHFAVDSALVLTKDLFDGTQGLDKLAPVHRAQETETADVVAHRDLIRSLLLVLGVHQLLDRPPRFGKSLLNPGER